jgi:hypothetical protein
LREEKPLAVVMHLVLMLTSTVRLGVICCMPLKGSHACSSLGRICSRRPLQGNRGMRTQEVGWSC